jgi:exo-beta-1,3-glucanase (GH17 family)
MKYFRLFIAFILITLFCQTPYAQTQVVKHKQADALHCVAFGPYIGKLTPDFGARPPKELISILLDRLVKETPFRCIMTYGVLNGLDYVFEAAKERHLKVIAILWLDNDSNINSKSIEKGIEVAKAFPETIIKLSCGSEVRTRHDYVFDGEINRCITSLRAAGVTQPITSIDTWWQWCNRSQPCSQASFAAQVDWIGINVFPWWENKYSEIHSCTPAAKAADFHIARIEEIQRTYPNKEIIITEFGWPNGPKNGTETNIKTKQKCGIASKQNQTKVIKETLNKLAKRNWSGVVFEAFSENWKPTNEGSFGQNWGICQDNATAGCIKDLNID